MRRLRPRSDPSILAALSADLLIHILERLPDPGDRKSWRLVCKEFLHAECLQRRRLTVFRHESLAPLVRRYRAVERLDLSKCPRVDGRAMVAAFGGDRNRRLRSVDLGRASAIRWWGLEVLVGSCSALEAVDLSHCCGVGDREMAALGRAKGLRSLAVSKCLGVTDMGLAAVAVGCPLLERLCLKWCLEISDIGIELLAKKCPGLKDLDISYLKVTNASLQSISYLGKLEILIMVECHLIDDDGLAYLDNGNNSLKSIDVSRCENVSSSGLISVIKGHSFLQKIDAGYCLPDITLPFLAKLKGLESHLNTLKLDGFQVSVLILQTIGLNCKKLVEIGLSKCNGVSDEGVSKLVTGNSVLRTIDLTCCHLITDGTLSVIAEFSKDLTCLKLESCTLITEKGLDRVASSCVHLQEIDLTDCGISDSALQSLSQCSKLVELKLGHCPVITDKGLSHIGKKCRMLQVLDLYRCIRIGDNGLASIGEGCRKLKKLNVCYCSEITDQGMKNLSVLQELSDLEMRKLTKVTNDGITAIALGCKSLVELDLKRCYSVGDMAIWALSQYSENIRQINVSYCSITDIGLCLLLGSMKCLQDAKLVHLSSVSVGGFEQALRASGDKLKKLKLLTALRYLINPSTIQVVQSHGCRIRWVDKRLILA